MHYKAVPVAVNATVNILGSHIGGFVPTTAGTWTFTLRQPGVPDIVLPGITVAAGNLGLCHYLPITVGTGQRSTLTCSGGGSGILLAG